MSHYFTKKQTGDWNAKEIESYLRGNKLKFITTSGVFSKDKVDAGTEVLTNSAIVDKGWKILDFGCGYGAVGIAIAKSCKCEVWMTDVNERAVMLAKKNAKLNDVDVKVMQSDIFENLGEQFNAIILNPPQSAGKELCFKMIDESKEHLCKSGLLQIVARPAKGGKTLANKMLETFGNMKEIAKRNGYKVYVSMRN